MLPKHVQPNIQVSRPGFLRRRVGEQSFAPATPEVIVFRDYTQTTPKKSYAEPITGSDKNIVRGEPSSIIKRDDNIIPFTSPKLVIQREHLHTNSLESRLKAIDEFASRHPGQPVSPLIRALFTELTEVATSKVAPPLPSQAPVLWETAKREWEVRKKADPATSDFDTPPAFIQRHYSPWLGNGLTRSDINRLDPKLYRALYNWRSHNTMPEGFDLPRVKDRNNRWVESLYARGIGQDGGPPDLESAERALSAIRRRKYLSSQRS